MQSLNELTPGRFLGRYELLMPIAQGGMAAVWAARLRGSRGFQKVVAIKTILPTLSDDPRFEQMFLDEAALASRIRHSNVVQVADLGEDQGLLYQVMEWIDGQALNALLRETKGGRGLPYPIAAKIMIGVCEGLHAAHEMKDDSGSCVGLVHRDVSPQNILVSVDGVPKVVDFGVAKASSLSGVRTTAGTFKGKPAYMAPEQILGGEVDRRADIFALGTVLYLITTGKHPFRGESEMATLHRVVDGKPPARPTELVAGYPSGLEFVILKAVARQPDDRFATASEMARALMQAVPEVQITGDTDVAACVRELGGKHLSARTDALRAALKEADQRIGAAGPSSGTLSEATQLEAPSILRPSTVTPPPSRESVTPREGVVASSPARPATRFMPVVGGVVAIAAAFVIGAVLFGKRHNPPAGPSTSADPAASAAAPPSAAASADAPATASASASAELEPAASAVSLDSLPKIPDQDPGRSGPSIRKDAGAPASTSTSKGYVPSIRDPGF